MKKINKFALSIFLLTLFFTINSCSKMKNYDGSRSYIEKFLGADALTALEQLDIPIYYGDTPPNIEGDYVASVHTVVETTVPEDPTPPFELTDFKFHFKNQNQKKLTLDFEAEEGADFLSMIIGEDYTEHKGKGTYISGHDDYFTVYIKDEVKTKLLGKAITSKIISGRITQSGIVDYKISALMIKIIRKDYIQPWIPENTARVAMDSDNLVENL